MGLNFFDGIIYINLDYRIDRKTEILNELKKFPIKQNKIHRIDEISSHD